MNVSSDDSVNINNTLHRNVRVKIEPGTSSSVSSDSGILKNIKMEPGVPTTTTQRLTSYRVPRDLTLGGNVKTEKPRKIYTPNLNAQRNRKKDEPVTSRVEPTKSKDTIRDHERGRDRGRGRRNLIQSVGVWSEGVNAPLVSRSTDSPRESRASLKKYLDRPKINLKKVVNKEEEEEKLKNLIGDDDDDNGDPDEKADYIMLPMNEQYYRRLRKKELKVDIDAHIDEKDVDKKPIISENGEVISVKDEKKVKMDMQKEIKEPKKELCGFLENKPNSYMLVELPPLPGRKSKNEKEDPKPKRSNDSRLTANANDVEDCACTLSDLNTGRLGKLEILKSGKARLRIGETYFDVTAGTHFSALQHVVATDLDTISLCGNLIALGPVTETLVCSVDPEYLYK